MSRFNEFSVNNEGKMKKNSVTLTDLTIQYSEDELENVMINGYKYMSEINLKIAEEDKNILTDICEYEAWLCGV